VTPARRHWLFARKAETGEAMQRMMHSPATLDGKARRTASKVSGSSTFGKQAPQIEK